MRFLTLFEENKRKSFQVNNGSTNELVRAEARLIQETYLAESSRKVVAIFLDV